MLTPEDREALDRAAKMTRKNFAIRHVREEGLKPWMRLVAAWYAVEGNALSRHEQLSKARRIAKDGMTYQTFRALLARHDFQELVERFTDDRVAAAREEFQALLPKVVNAVEWSIDEARKAEDYKAIPAVVDPVLTRTMPKKDHQTERPPVLVINLGTGFAEKYADRPAQEVQVEELPPPPREEIP